MGLLLLIALKKFLLHLFIGDGHKYTMACVWRSDSNSGYHFSPSTTWAQVIRFGSKWPNPLNLLTGPFLIKFPNYISSKMLLDECKWIHSYS